MAPSSEWKPPRTFFPWYAPPRRAAPRRPHCLCGIRISSSEAHSLGTLTPAGAYLPAMLLFSLLALSSVCRREYGSFGQLSYSDLWESGLHTFSPNRSDQILGAHLERACGSGPAYAADLRSHDHLTHGCVVSNRSIRRCRWRGPAGSCGQTWRTSLRNHAHYTGRRARRSSPSARVFKLPGMLLSQ
jgi:hypothetical protein